MNQHIQEYDVVQVCRSVPDLAFLVGCEGTVLQVFGSPPKDCLVEFADAVGQTLRVEVICADALKVIWRGTD
jgi:hypothetical protein